MNLECMVLFTNELTKIKSIIDRYMSHDGRIPLDKPPATRLVKSNRRFSTKRSRYLVLSAVKTRGWKEQIVLCEAGELMDWDMGAEIARETRLQSVIYALHDSVNAWGYAHYKDGHLIQSIFRPLEMFGDLAVASGNKNEPWDGDAWQEAHEFVESIGIAEPFLSYEHIAKGEVAIPDAHRECLCYRYADDKLPP